VASAVSTTRLPLTPLKVKTSKSPIPFVVPVRIWFEVIGPPSRSPGAVVVLLKSTS